MFIIVFEIICHLGAFAKKLVDSILDSSRSFVIALYKAAGLLMMTMMMMMMMIMMMMTAYRSFLLCQIG